jgi:hypothetical protein
MQTFFVWLAIAEPSLIKSEPENQMFDKAIIEMRMQISGDPYDRATLRQLYAAITSV